MGGYASTILSARLAKIAIPVGVDNSISTGNAEYGTWWRQRISNVAGAGQAISPFAIRANPYPGTGGVP